MTSTSQWPKSSLHWLQPEIRGRSSLPAEGRRSRCLVPAFEDSEKELLPCQFKVEITRRRSHTLSFDSAFKPQSLRPPLNSRKSAALEECLVVAGRSSAFPPIVRNTPPKHSHSSGLPVPSRAARPSLRRKFCLAGQNLFKNGGYLETFLNPKPCLLPNFP